MYHTFVLMLVFLFMPRESEAFVTPSHGHRRVPSIKSSTLLQPVYAECADRRSDLLALLGEPISIAQQQQWRWRWNIPAWSACVLVVSLALAFTPAPALAAVVNPSVFRHEYADPLHPQCLRRIEVSRDGTTFHYSGTAVGPKDDPVIRGCSAQEIKEFGIRRGEFDGLIVGRDGKISAGDGVHEGVWEPAHSVSGQPFDDVDGIRWNDGNKWTVVKKSWATQVGEFIFLSYISVSTAAGAKGLYDGIQRKRAESNEL